MALIREDQADIRVWVENVPYGDSWATVEGGHLEADIAKTRPGGMGREVAAGGPASRGDATLTIQFSDIVAGWHGRLESLAGNGRVRYRVNWLNPDRTPTGRGFTRQGVLASPRVPDHGQGSSVGMYTIVVSNDEVAAQ